MRLPGRAPRARERNKLCVCFWEWESQKMGCYISVCVQTHKKSTYVVCFDQRYASHMCSTHVALASQRGGGLYTQWINTLVHLLAFPGAGTANARSAAQLAPIWFFASWCPLAAPLKLIQQYLYQPRCCSRAVINIPIFSFLRTSGFHREQRAH
jgi:hypothetical protein